jgi:hypothetical protein
VSRCDTKNAPTLSLGSTKPLIPHIRVVAVSGAAPHVSTYYAVLHISNNVLVLGTVPTTTHRQRTTSHIFTSSSGLIDSFFTERSQSLINPIQSNHQTQTEMMMTMMMMEDKDNTKQQLSVVSSQQHRLSIASSKNDNTTTICSGIDMGMGMGMDSMDMNMRGARQSLLKGSGTSSTANNSSRRNALFVHLQSLRVQFSKSHQLTNDVLADIVVQLPSTPMELMRCLHMTPMLVQMYGDPILQDVANYKQSELEREQAEQLQQNRNLNLKRTRNSTSPITTIMPTPDESMFMNETFCRKFSDITPDTMADPQSVGMLSSPHPKRIKRASVPAAGAEDSNSNNNSTCMIMDSSF